MYHEPLWCCARSHTISRKWDVRKQGRENRWYYLQPERYYLWWHLTQGSTNNTKTTMIGSDKPATTTAGREKITERTFSQLPFTKQTSASGARFSRPPRSKNEIIHENLAKSHCWCPQQTPWYLTTVDVRLVELWFESTTWLLSANTNTSVLHYLAPWTIESTLPEHAAIAQT